MLFISQITTINYDTCRALLNVLKSWNQIGQHHPYFFSTLVFAQYLATAKNQASQIYDVIGRDLAPSNVEKELPGTSSFQGIKQTQLLLCFSWKFKISHWAPRSLLQCLSNLGTGDLTYWESLLLL